MKLGKDALEDAEFREYLLSNNQPDQESLCTCQCQAPPTPEVGICKAEL